MLCEKELPVPYFPTTLRKKTTQATHNPVCMLPLQQVIKIRINADMLNTLSAPQTKLEWGWGQGPNLSFQYYFAAARQIIADSGSIFIVT